VDLTATQTCQRFYKLYCDNITGLIVWYLTVSEVEHILDQSAPYNKTRGITRIVLRLADTILVINIPELLLINV